MNPYLNTPPTKLRRDIENEDDPAKRKQMKDALNAWRLTVPGPFRRGKMNRESVARELLSIAKALTGAPREDRDAYNARMTELVEDNKSAVVSAYVGVIKNVVKKVNADLKTPVQGEVADGTVLDFESPSRRNSFKPRYPQGAWSVGVGWPIIKFRGKLEPLNDWRRIYGSPIGVIKKDLMKALERLKMKVTLPVEVDGKRYSADFYVKISPVYDPRGYVVIWQIGSQSEKSIVEDAVPPDPDQIVRDVRSNFAEAAGALFENDSFDAELTYRWYRGEAPSWDSPGDPGGPEDLDWDDDDFKRHATFDKLLGNMGFDAEEMDDLNEAFPDKAELFNRALRGFGKYTQYDANVDFDVSGAGGNYDLVCTPYVKGNGVQFDFVLPDRYVDSIAEGIEPPDDDRY